MEYFFYDINENKSFLSVRSKDYFFLCGIVRDMEYVLEVGLVWIFFKILIEIFFWDIEDVVIYVKGNIIGSY